MPTTPNDRLTLRQAAKEYGVNAGTLRQAINRKRLSATKAMERGGPVWYVSRADLDAYIEQRSRKGSSESNCGIIEAYKDDAGHRS